MSKVIIKLGADISTDDIYPGRYMATVLPTETPQFCFSDRTDFNGKLKAKAFRPGSVIVADANFGCGSSREQAVSAIKGHELIIVARSIARIFLQNGINLGLRMVLCPGIEAEEGRRRSRSPPTRSSTRPPASASTSSSSPPPARPSSTPAASSRSPASACSPRRGNGVSLTPHPLSRQGRARGSAPSPPSPSLRGRGGPGGVRASRARAREGALRAAAP